MKLWLTRNKELISGELLCEADKSGRKFLRFFFFFPFFFYFFFSLRPRQRRARAEVAAISPAASLSIPLTYYIAFSCAGSPKSHRSLIKLKLPLFFRPWRRSTKTRYRGKFERSRAKFVLSRNNRARFIHRWECAIGKFSQGSVPRTGRIFGWVFQGQFPGKFPRRKRYSILTCIDKLFSLRNLLDAVYKNMYIYVLVCRYIYIISIFSNTTYKHTIKLQ